MVCTVMEHEQRLGPFDDMTRRGNQDPFMMRLEIKGPYADHILIPQGSTGSSTFLNIK